jgi:hypothetical protein
VLHAYQHAVSTRVPNEEHPALRYKSPLAGVQGHAVLHAYQLGVSLRVRNEAAPRFTFFSCGLALRGLRHLRLRPDLSGL